MTYGAHVTLITPREGTTHRYLIRAVNSSYIEVEHTGSHYVFQVPKRDMPAGARYVGDVVSCPALDDHYAAYRPTEWRYHETNLYWDDDR